MPTAKELMLMGLPAAGKTTFLAALWHLVESKDVPSDLTLDRMEGDRSYLNLIRDQWLSCLPLERTDPETEQTVRLALRPKAGGEAFELLVPDLAGESYRAQWRDRLCRPADAAQAAVAQGMLLLVSSRVNKPTLLSDVLRAIEALQEPMQKKAAAGKPPQMKPWDPERAPTQVQLVDLVQHVVAARSLRRMLKVAVLVTAWDLIPSPPAPDVWMASELPLLDQYLRANPEWINLRVYGLSAQGGDYGDAEKKRKMQDHLLHAERITMLGPECGAHDLTAPLRWLLL